jgi:hypothetical protein
VRGGGGGLDSLPILLAVIIGLAYFGPTVAHQLASSLGEIGLALAPVVAPVLLIVLVWVVIRSYWNRW